MACACARCSRPPSHAARVMLINTDSLVCVRACVYSCVTRVNQLPTCEQPNMQLIARRRRRARVVVRAKAKCALVCGRQLANTHARPSPQGSPVEHATCDTDTKTRTSTRAIRSVNPPDLTSSSARFAACKCVCQMSLRCILHPPSAY